LQDDNNGAHAPEFAPGQSGAAEPATKKAASRAQSGVAAAASAAAAALERFRPGGGGGGRSAPPPPGGDGGDDEEEGMLRMSFLEHLEELRSRILKALAGLGVAFLVSLIFANDLWNIVKQPATYALRSLGYPEKLAQITPMEVFSTVWFKLPMLAAVFLASPWVLYQVWAFIAPGLYKRERRWAAPFVISSAGLFILGGLFAYFVAFRYGLTFLLGIGRDISIQPMVSVTEYFDLFVNVMLGVGLVFEMPVLIFFLTLLHIVTPGFLIRHSRHAILAITILAAIVTPTPDVFNMMLFAVPMCLLFYVGVFASYLLVLHRENRRFPWRTMFLWLAIVFALVAGALYFTLPKYGYHFVSHWPFLTR
jgi:sec-independent protein translocase protein TatC